ncbi:protein of unknown function [Micropruina glycogenica]|uniref:Uncharacterized protein n=1 Tax=Micropruina glycogenica TaxID=75385 RepID=A0A2N9JCD0_9ACTN|nr:protein of unknown function [Micropruina glycogenica]
MVAILLIRALLIGFVLSGVILITGSTPAACNLGGRAVYVDPNSVPEGPIAGYDHAQPVNAAHVMVAAQKLGLTVRDQQIGVMTANRPCSPPTWATVRCGRTARFWPTSWTAIRCCRCATTWQRICGAFSPR